MPRVNLMYRQNHSLEQIAHNLATILPGLVAEALTTENDPQGDLMPYDIEVIVTETDSQDVNVRDLGIYIAANDYEERRTNLDQRREKITEGVRGFLSDYDRNLTGYVWIQLSHGSFGNL